MMIIITQKTSNRASNNTYLYLQQVDPAKEYTTRTINDNKGIHVKRRTEKKKDWPKITRPKNETKNAVPFFASRTNSTNNRASKGNVSGRCKTWK